jgi:hypothetical protein
MVRLEQPEEVYEVESVFGRDAASVFPNMKTHDDPLEALKATMGAKKFVTETEVGLAVGLCTRQRAPRRRTRGRQTAACLPPTPTPRARARAHARTHTHTHMPLPVNLLREAGGDQEGARPDRGRRHRVCGQAAGRGAGGAQAGQAGRV